MPELVAFSTPLSRNGLLALISAAREWGITVPEPTEPEIAFICGEIDRVTFEREQSLAFPDQRDEDGYSTLNSRVIQWRRAVAQIRAMNDYLVEVYGPMPENEDRATTSEALPRG